MENGLWKMKKGKALGRSRFDHGKWLMENE
jgi:hypothetical protein